MVCVFRENKKSYYSFHYCAPPSVACLFNLTAFQCVQRCASAVNKLKESLRACEYERTHTH